LQNTRLHLR